LLVIIIYEFSEQTFCHKSCFPLRRFSLSRVLLLFPMSSVFATAWKLTTRDYQFRRWRANELKWNPSRLR